MNLSGEAVSLFVAIIGSAFGVVAYASRKFAELSTNMTHVIRRIDALEDDIDELTGPKKPSIRRARGR